MFKKVNTFVSVFLLVCLAISSISLAKPKRSKKASQETSTKVQFEPGKNSSVIKGTLAPFASREYIFQANRHQILNAKLNSKQNLAVFDIYGADDLNMAEANKSSLDKNSHFVSPPLSAEGEYKVMLINTVKAPVPYTLEVSVK